MDHHKPTCCFGQGTAGSGGVGVAFLFLVVRGIQDGVLVGVDASAEAANEAVIEAPVAAFALLTVLGSVALKFLGRQLAAVAGAGNIHHGVGGDRGVAGDIARGDLQAVEEKAGLLGIDARSGEGVEDLGEGQLDRGAIFKDGELERRVFGLGFGFGGLVHAGMEVAEGRIAKRSGAALFSAGHDVTTFSVHSGTYPPPPPYLCKQILCFHDFTRWVAA